MTSNSTNIPNNLLQPLDEELDAATSLVGADLRGANLAGQTLTHLSLRGANLDGADLSDVRLIHVDLSEASLRGARLDRTQMRFVTAQYAMFTDISASYGSWRHVDFSQADFVGSNLRSTMFYLCNLEQTLFERANLSHTQLLSSNCDKAQFCHACLEHSNTIASTFEQADFTGAQQFFTSREIIVEILSREMHDDFKFVNLIGAAKINPRWCYPEWTKFLANEPEYRELTLKIFQKYPESGFVEALRIGRRHLRHQPPFAEEC